MDIISEKRGDILHISFEGILGARKSSFFSYFKNWCTKNRMNGEIDLNGRKFKKVNFLSEPNYNKILYDHYDHIDYYPLQEFYEDPKQNGFATQMLIINNLQDQFDYFYENYKPLKKEHITHRNSLLVSDRSLLSPYVFINAQYKLGNLSKYSSFVLKKFILPKDSESSCIMYPIYEPAYIHRKYLPNLIIFF